MGGNMSVGSSNKNQFRIRLTYDFNTLETILIDDLVTEEDNRKRQVRSYILQTEYGISDRIGISVVLPYIHQLREINSGLSIDKVVAQGIGDIMFLVKYSPIILQDNKNIGLTLGVGPKFATGNTLNKADAFRFLSLDLQPGSGAIDYVFWLSFLKTNLLKNQHRLHAMFTMNYRMTTAVDNHEVWGEAELGNELQLTGGFYDRFYIGAVSIDPLLLIRYRSVVRDVRNGQTVDQSGGEEYQFMPGFNVNPSPKITWNFNINLPIYRRMNGTQVATTYKFSTSIAYRFSVKKDDDIIFLIPDEN